MSQSKRSVSGVWQFFSVPDPGANPHLAECKECSASIRRGKPGQAAKDYQVYNFMFFSKLLKYLEVLLD